MCIPEPPSSDGIAPIPVEELAGAQIETMVMTSTDALAIGVEYEPHVIHPAKSLTLAPSHHFQ